MGHGQERNKADEAQRDVDQGQDQLAWKIAI
jgi:hypothetical protein